MPTLVERDVLCDGCGKKIGERTQPGHRGVNIKCRHCGVINQV